MTSFVFKILRYSGLPFIVREVIQRSKVTIVMMHDISPKAAEQAFRFWQNNYNIISFSEYLDARMDKKELPPKSLILTLDDGHKGNYKLLPLIERFKIPVTIFLCSSIAGTNRHFWFLHENIDADNLKKLSDKERLRTLKQMGFGPEKEYLDRQVLSSIEIEEMKSSSFIDFQSHTKFHPVLPQCSADRSLEEISGSKKEIEEKFGLTVNGFAYPNGDFAEREVNIIKRSGYSYAVTVDPGYNTLKSDIFKLKRFSVNDSENIDEIVVKTCGVWGMGKRFLH